MRIWIIILMIALCAGCAIKDKTTKRYKSSEAFTESYGLEFLDQGRILSNSGSFTVKFTPINPDKEAVFSSSSETGGINSQNMAVEVKRDTIRTEERRDEKTSANGKKSGSLTQSGRDSESETKRTSTMLLVVIGIAALLLIVLKVKNPFK